MPDIIIHNRTSLSSKKFFSSGFKTKKSSDAHSNLPPSHGSLRTSSNTTAAPTIEELSGTAWRSSSECAAAVASQSKNGNVRRSSMDSPGREKRSSANNQKLRHHSMHLLQSRSDRGLLDTSSSRSSSERGIDLDGSGRSSARQEFRRPPNADPPTENVTSSPGRGKSKEIKKKRQQDAPEERSGKNGGSSEQKQVQEPSFQDLLKNLKGNKASTRGGGLGVVEENNPFVVPTVPEYSVSKVHFDSKSKSTENTGLNLPGFKSTPSQPSDTLQALLDNAQNFSSDSSVCTMNTTTQCAMSLAKLIEEMQDEFQKLKRQKNKAESYAEKLHTDYVRMQESLERDYEKACHERDELKVAREKDTHAIDKLKDEVKALKSENAALKESGRAEEERRKIAEEENGRMKVALEALLVSGGAVKKDGKLVIEDGGGRRLKKEKLDRANITSKAFSQLHLEQRNSFNSSSPDVIKNHPSFHNALSADQAKPKTTVPSSPRHAQSVDSNGPSFETNCSINAPSLPFDAHGNYKSSAKNMLPFGANASLKEHERRITSSTEQSSPMSSNEDIQSDGSNGTHDEGSLDTPTYN